MIISNSTTTTPCPVGYTGTFCQTPLCNGVVNGCANGGTCSGMLIIDILSKKQFFKLFFLFIIIAPSVCTCPTGWTGPSCSTSKQKY